jgi:hypothetical protein
MAARKLKDGTWKGTGSRFNIVAIKPNLKKSINTVLSFEDSKGFMGRLERVCPIVKTKKVKLRIKKFGGCWRIANEDGKLLFFHDLEYVDKERIHKVSKRGRRKKKKW